MKKGPDTVGEKLKNARKARGLTLEQVANRVGVDRATVLRWERGEIKSIKGNRLSELSSCLGIPVSELLGGGYEPRPGLELPLAELRGGALADTGRSLSVPLSCLPGDGDGIFAFLLEIGSEGFLPGDILILRERAGDSDVGFLMPDGSVRTKENDVPENAVAGVVWMLRYFKT